MTTDSEFYILIIIGVAALATFLWRALGVYVGRKFQSEHPLIQWASALAYSTVTALSLKLVVFPEGPLGQTRLFDRLMVLVVAFSVFFITKRNVLAACLTGVGLFGILLYWRE